MTSFRNFALTVAASVILPMAASAATAVDIDAKANSSNTTDRTVSTNFLALTLERGVYEITPIDRGGAGGFTALTVWNNVQGCNGLGEGCSKGWFWRVDLISEGDNLQPSGNGGTSSRINLTSDRFSTAGAAFAAADASGPALFKLLADDTVYFGVTDTPIGDNAGGVSFDLERVGAVPLPLPAALLLGGVGLLGAVRARRG
ncbi:MULTISPECIES: hypothetical protein [Meridianimarinicoccus]|uniref:hypothetical protein n=1 Tax=Meridianimarinicoccus zhengii TaxID=2056810 RepID=UPI000DABD81C|nr:hypothetical protein [Phycocomes zhengii]